MSKKAEEAALKAYPKGYASWDWEHLGPPDYNEFERKAYKKGYEQTEKDIISLIQSRIAEIVGDAQPKPILRMELQNLIDKIKDNNEK